MEILKTIPEKIIKPTIKCSCGTIFQFDEKDIQTKEYIKYSFVTCPKKGKVKCRKIYYNINNQLYYINDYGFFEQKILL